MEMSGQQLIPATKEKVWTALNDPDVLRVCIPGCQELTKSSDTEMSAIAVMKVGPVKARFQGAVTLSDLDPPNGYKITGEGQGGVAGFAKGTAVVKLSEAAGGTLLDYTVDAQIGGKLSQLGGRLIDVTAKQMAGQFFKRFAEEVQGERSSGPARAEGAEPAVSQVAAPSVRRDTPATAPIRSVQSPAAVGSNVSLLAVAGVVFLSVLAALWIFHGGLLPGIAPGTEAPGRVPPHLADVVQLVMVGAVGYLLGKTSR